MSTVIPEYLMMRRVWKIPRLQWSVCCSGNIKYNEGYENEGDFGKEDCWGRRQGWEETMEGDRISNYMEWIGLSVRKGGSKTMISTRFSICQMLPCINASDIIFRRGLSL